MTIVTVYELFKQASKEEMAELLAGLIAATSGHMHPETTRVIYKVILAKLGQEVTEAE